MPLTPITADTTDAELAHLRGVLRHPEGDPMPWGAHTAELIDLVLAMRAQLRRRVGGLAEFPIVTLCGSTRFRRAYREWTARLELEEGALVFSSSSFPGAGERTLTDAQKIKADEMHLAKIARSDAIFVLDVGGYVGESTADEIRFAQEHGVPVRRLSEEHPGWTEADCIYARPEEPPPAASRRATEGDGP